MGDMRPLSSPARAPLHISGPIFTLHRQDSRRPPSRWSLGAKRHRPPVKTSGTFLLTLLRITSTSLPGDGINIACAKPGVFNIGGGYRPRCRWLSLRAHSESGRHRQYAVSMVKN